MSAFAPFVAAAIRDKVVLELMEENEDMRKQVAKLRHFKTVEITGPGGDRVYTRAQFDEDGGYKGNPNLWSVHFPTDQQLVPCPLPMLDGIQVRLGGVVHAAFINTNNASFETSLDEDARDHENGKVVSFLFSGSSSLWLTVMVDGWPRERWQATIDEDIIDAEEPLLGHLVQTIATEAPTNKMVTFLEVDFFVNSVRGVIETLDFNADQDLEQRREELTFLEVILARMRTAGNDAGPPEISAQALAILSALARVGVRGVGDLYELAIGPLLRSQMRRTREGFEIFVNHLVSSINEGRLDDMLPLVALF
jgi:hypothetical protein